MDKNTNYEKPDFEEILALEKIRREGGEIPEVIINLYRGLPKEVWDELVEKAYGFHFMTPDAVSIDRFLNGLNDEEVKEKYDLHVPEGYIIRTDFEAINRYDWTVGTNHYNDLKEKFGNDLIRKIIFSYSPEIQTQIFSVYDIENGIKEGKENRRALSDIEISGDDYLLLCWHSNLIQREKEVLAKRANNQTEIEEKEQGSKKL